MDPDKASDSRQANHAYLYCHFHCWFSNSDQLKFWLIILRQLAWLNRESM